MIIIYLSQHRPDIAETTKELARYMQDPKPSDMERLKRLGRYLKGRPRGVFIFREQVLPTSIDIYVDSDHAGCKRTRKTTGGFVAHHGEHVVKIGSQVHSTISLSSGESEFYQLVKGSAVGLSIQSLMNDWGLPLEVQILSDSSAARSFSSRRGLGKQRHVQTRYLWIQERVAQKHLRIVKVLGDDNHSDILTKAIPQKTLDKHLQRMSFEFRSGYAGKQKQTL